MKENIKQISNISEIDTNTQELRFYEIHIENTICDIVVITEEGINSFVLYKNGVPIQDKVIKNAKIEWLKDIIDTIKDRPNLAEQVFVLYGAK